MRVFSSEDRTRSAKKFRGILSLVRQRFDLRAPKYPEIFLRVRALAFRREKILSFFSDILVCFYLSYIVIMDISCGLWYKGQAKNV